MFTEKEKILDFIGFIRTQKSYDLSLLHIDSYFALYSTRKDQYGRRLEAYEIMINKKGVDARCKYSWKPEEDWNALFMIIDKICSLLNSGYAEFFDTLPKNIHTIEEVYKEVAKWVLDYVERIERIKREREK